MRLIFAQISFCLSVAIIAGCLGYAIRRVDDEALVAEARQSILDARRSVAYAKSRCFIHWADRR